MSKKYERRVSELVRTYLATLIERRMNDPRVAGITVTDVEVTADTRYAKVFYSLIGDEQARQQAARGLESAAGWLRRELGMHLRTKHTPELIFEYDPSLEHGARMSQLLDELKAKEIAVKPGDETGSAAPNREVGGQP
ncbi:MAG: 30S ribosome-binding factor RbfA [Chloroflexi bacterium]|nr:30S ribosome-binding factor RbfA [Chloroflexota bacterium]